MRTIFPLVLIAVGWLQPVQADEPRTFCGRSVEGWIEVLRNKGNSEALREKAAWALGCFGPEARAAAPDLIDVVRREQGWFKEEAIDALVPIGAGTEVTIPIFIERFVEKGCHHLTGMGTFLYSTHIRDRLVRIGSPAVPALVDVLKGPDKAARVCAAEALGVFGPVARTAVPALIHAIEQSRHGQESDAITRFAVRSLGRIGPEARAAVPVFNRLIEEEGVRKHDSDNAQGESDVMASLRDRAREERIFEMVKALDGIGAPLPVRKRLDEFLRQGDPSVALELAWLGPKARVAVPSLRDALSDKRLQVRISAAMALAYIDSSVTAAVPVLIDALNYWDEPNLDVWDVPRALGQFGPKAKAALPNLMALVKKREGGHEALGALVRIDPEGEECVPTLVLILEEGDYQQADLAAHCLGLLGPHAKEAVPALVANLIRDFEDGFSNGFQPQVSAAQALRRIGPGAKPAIPALIEAVKRRTDDYSCEVAEAAAKVLGSFGDDAKAAVPVLMEAIQDEKTDDMSWYVRRAAVLALGQIGPAAKAAIPMLRSLMDKKGTASFYQAEIVIALFQLAPDGRRLAEEWNKHSLIDSATRSRGAKGDTLGVEQRAMVLGVIGLASFEGDWLTRNRLELLDTPLVKLHPAVELEGALGNLKWRFENIARLGVAARVAIPRLRGLTEHPDPWVRMWAAETLEAVAPTNRHEP